MKHQKILWKPREEWVAVPVPDSGIPRQVADAARDAVKDNPSVRLISDYRGLRARRRIRLRCLRPPYDEGPQGERSRLYRALSLLHLPLQDQRRLRRLRQVRGFRAEPVEELVWQSIRSLMLEPEALHDALERMVEQERSGRARRPR